MMKRICEAGCLFLMSVLLFTGCSGSKDTGIDSKMNDTREYEAVEASSSILSYDSYVQLKEAYDLTFPNEEGSMYIGEYSYQGIPFVAGYAVDCDFKTWLDLPSLETAMADTIAGKNYTICLYSDDVKAAYYYPEEDTCIFIYVEEDMSVEDFSSLIESVDLKIFLSE